MVFSLGSLQNLKQKFTQLFFLNISQHPQSHVAEAAEQFACQPHIIAIFFSSHTKENTLKQKIFCISLNYKKKKGNTFTFGGD